MGNPRPGFWATFRHARSLFLFEEDLREKRPQGHRRRIHGTLFPCEVGMGVGEGFVDLFFRQDLGEDQPVLLQKRCLNEAKSS